MMAGAVEWYRIHTELWYVMYLVVELLSMSLVQSSAGPDGSYWAVMVPPLSVMSLPVLALARCVTATPIPMIKVAPSDRAIRLRVTRLRLARYVGTGSSPLVVMAAIRPRLPQR